MQHFITTSSSNLDLVINSEKMKVVSICHFKEIRKYLKRSSNSSDELIERGDNGVIVCILQKDSGVCHVVAHQNFGHFYCILNAPILGSGPEMVANEFDPRVVHSHLQDFAVYKGMRRQFIFKFESENVAKKFMDVFKSLQEQRKEEKYLDTICDENMEDLNGEYQQQSNALDKNTLSKQEEHVGKCKSCGFFGVFGLQCCHCEDGHKYEEEEESDDESTMDDEAKGNGEGSEKSESPEFLVEEGKSTNPDSSFEGYESEDDFAATQSFPSLPLLPFGEFE